VLQGWRFTLHSMTSAPDTLVDKNVSLTKRKKKRHEMKQRRINDGTFINQLSNDTKKTKRMDQKKRNVKV